MDFKNRFVLPIPSFLRGHLLPYNRLYAYPVAPEAVGDAEFIILDSGGYSLWKQGRTMSRDYIDQLAQHYYKYGKEDQVFCAAPDKSQDAKRTIQNTQYFLKTHTAPICPIFHFPDCKFDLSLLRYQIAAYKEMFGECPFVFWGGTMDKAARMLNPALKYKLALLREELNVQWIHFLGAGWNRREVDALSKFDTKISFDTLAYYNCASEKVWSANDWGNWVEGDKRSTAIQNAMTALDIVQKHTP